MANKITIARLPLLALILGMLFWGNAASRLITVILILILILMDSLDGFIARRRNESSLLGSALDIAADRAVELVLWVSFSALGLVSLVIPLVVIVRGTLTDSIRAVASSHGVRAYDMLRSDWANFLVASPTMRTTYAVAKGFAFCLLALTLGLDSLWPATTATSPQETVLRIVTIAGQAFSWTALILCVLRGIPVLVEAPGYFKAHEQSETSS